MPSGTASQFSQAGIQVRRGLAGWRPELRECRSSVRGLHAAAKRNPDFGRAWQYRILFTRSSSIGWTALVGPLWPGTDFNPSLLKMLREAHEPWDQVLQSSNPWRCC